MCMCVTGTGYFTANTVEILVQFTSVSSEGSGFLKKIKKERKPSKLNQTVDLNGKM